MKIYFDNGDVINATVSGGTNQEQLRDLARLLDEIEAGNTTEWVDDTPEVFLTKEQEELINNIVLEHWVN